MARETIAFLITSSIVGASCCFAAAKQVKTACRSLSRIFSRRSRPTRTRQSTGFSARAWRAAEGIADTFPGRGPSVLNLLHLSIVKRASFRTIASARETTDGRLKEYMDSPIVKSLNLLVEWTPHAEAYLFRSHHAENHRTQTTISGLLLFAANVALRLWRAFQLLPCPLHPPSMPR